MHLLLTLFFSLFSFSVFADGNSGVYPDRIVFGQAAALKGPARDLGLGMRSGLLAAFGAVNAKGGVQGRKIVLRSKDDGYEPDKTVIAMRHLIEKEKVFAIVGNVGTPTSKMAAPLAKQNGVPFIGPFTGAEFLRNRKILPNVVNVRASYYQEAEVWVQYLTSIGVKRIAVFYQDDSFGRAGLRGVRRALAKRGMRIVARGSYARNLTAVYSALFTIRKSDPEAILMVGAYRPSAEFIRHAKSMGLNATFINVSFVGMRALARDLGEARDEVIVSQVMPSYLGKELPLIAQYHRDMKRYAPKDAIVGFVALEGYVVGRMVIEALKRIKGNPTREKLMSAIFESGQFNLGGLRIHYRSGSNQGMFEVHLIRLNKDGSFKPVAWKQKARIGK